MLALVWKNPVNGRGAIYLASHAYAVEGMDPTAGKKLIDELTEAATAPGTSYLHPWHRGDVVMWDNRATMHRGRPWPAPEPRLMIRTTISATDADGVGSMRPPAVVAGGGIAVRRPGYAPFSPTWRPSSLHALGCPLSSTYA